MPNDTAFPNIIIWSFGPKIGSVDGICHQTDSMNRFYLDVKTGQGLTPDLNARDVLCNTHSSFCIHRGDFVVPGSSVIFIINSD